MAAYIFLDNYRGFKDQLIPLTRVNFLVGENSTGKSSFLDLMETLTYPPFWVFEPRFGVPDSNQRHFLDLVSAQSKNKKSFTIGALSITKQGASADTGMIVTYVNSEGRPVPSRVSVLLDGKVRTAEGKLWITKQESYTGKVRPRVLSKDPDELERARSVVTSHFSEGRLEQLRVPDDLQGSPLLMRCQEVLFEGVGFEDRSVKVPYPLGSGQMVNVAPIRTRTRRTYDAPHTEFSREGDHTPYVIRKRLASASQAEVFKNFLERAGKDSGLFESIKVKSYGRGPLAPFELQVVLGKTALALDNVGYGVSQVLPILVEMFTRPKGTLLTIQQPEVHLHPKAQATLGDLVAQLAREEDKRFLIETHSDFAIDRFRLNVRGGGPIPSQLLFFERTANGNVATPIKIGDAGELPEDQPSSYREFFFNESLALLS